MEENEIEDAIFFGNAASGKAPFLYGGAINRGSKKSSFCISIVELPKFKDQLEHDLWSAGLPYDEDMKNVIIRAEAAGMDYDLIIQNIARAQIIKNIYPFPESWGRMDNDMAIGEADLFLKCQEVRKKQFKRTHFRKSSREI